jgi:bifunctional DNase/RNase
MYKLEIADLVLRDNKNQAQIIFEDENGDFYAFSLTPERARLVYLLVYQTYVQKNTIYEVFLNFIGALGIKVKSVVIEDVENLSAYLVLETQDLQDIKMTICTQDAFVIGLMSQAEFYIKKDTCFVDHVEYCWLDFVKRFLGG